ncbi:globin [Fulvivirga sp. M361]|uniref:globin n=1 Tax=Fulvivirga sp. M361 TaxID=2594266 RepID=UPI00117B8093|nr:globin [Fulvivirga sp. M361]TRX51873.1 globin [Fulvivirga sp. M361]
MKKHKLAEDQVLNVQSSYRRCLASGDFVISFYDRFLSSNVQVAEKFITTDFGAQYKALRHAISLIIMFADGSNSGESGLERIAESHSRMGLNVDPKLYPIWKSALLDTVEIYDRKYDAALRKSWNNVIDAGIEFILNKY